MKEMRLIKKLSITVYSVLLFVLFIFLMNGKILAEETESIQVSFDEETYCVTYEVTHPEYEYMVYVNRPYGVMVYEGPVESGENKCSIASCLNKSGTYSITVYAHQKGDRDNILLSSETISFKWEIPKQKTENPGNVHLEVRDGELYACWDKVECGGYGLSFYYDGVYKYSSIANSEDNDMKVDGISFDAGHAYKFDIYAKSPDYSVYLDSDTVESEELVKESGISFEFDRKTARVRYSVENNTYIYITTLTRPDGTKSEFYDTSATIGVNEVNYSSDLTMDGIYSIVIIAWDDVNKKRVLDSSALTFEWKTPDRKADGPINLRWERIGDYVYACWNPVDSNGYEISLYVDGDYYYSEFVNATQNRYKYFSVSSIEEGTQYQFVVKAISPDYEQYNDSEYIKSDYLDYSSLVPKESVLDIFDDIKPDSWCVSAVQFVYDNGIMGGKGKSFKPDARITRAEFVRILFNHTGAKAEDITIDNSFPDVEPNQWYTNAILWAKQNNIANGNGDGTFGVSNPIQRQAVASMLYKYAILKGYDTVIDSHAIDGFSDAEKVPTWSKEALKWAVTQGIMNGKNGRLDPAGYATRAESASMIKKLLEKNSGK